MIEKPENEKQSFQSTLHLYYNFGKLYLLKVNSKENDCFWQKNKPDSSMNHLFM